MKYNTAEIAGLQPDYLGFIFYEQSPRYFEGKIPKLPLNVKKVGVFVDEEIEEVVSKVKTHKLEVIQLHGNESAHYCKKLKTYFNFNDETQSDDKILSKRTATEIIKVFSIKNEFNFEILKPYENTVDYYLFDTKGQQPGGNGYIFNWQVLNNYPSTKPYFLSGGIGLEEITQLLNFLKTEKAKYCYAIDINSKFEIKPGLKNLNQIKEFKNRVLP